MVSQLRRRPSPARTSLRGLRPAPRRPRAVARSPIKETLLTYAKKVTVSVLYWYARSFRFIRQSLGTAPRGADFFCPVFCPLLAAPECLGLRLCVRVCARGLSGCRDASCPLCGSLSFGLVFAAGRRCRSCRCPPSPAIRLGGPTLRQSQLPQHRVRPYLVESTTSRPICEVKQPQAQPVLRSLMTREP